MAFNCFELMTHPAECQEYAAPLSFEILYRSLLFRNCKIGCLSSYHATEKLHDVSRAVDKGDIQKVVGELKQHAWHCPPGSSAVGCFSTNRQRMRYQGVCEQGLCVASVAVESGCKDVIGVRLKQSGMRWPLYGTNSIAALREKRLI